MELNNNGMFQDPLETEYQRQIAAEYQRAIADPEYIQQFYPIFKVLVDCILKQLRTMKGDVGGLYLRLAQNAAIDFMRIVYQIEVPREWL
jgi:hypothetical protein